MFTAPLENPRTALSEAFLDLDTIATHCKLESVEPDDSSDLETELARQNNVSRDNILVSSSSLGILSRLLQGVDSLGIFAPDYFEYASMCKNPVWMQRRADWGIPEPREEVEAIVVSNPNNPTGAFNNLTGLIEYTNRRDVLLVVDEAYIEFVGEENSAARAIEENRNLVVIRTFSKFYGLTRDKVGYAISSPHNLEKARDCPQPTVLGRRDAIALLNGNGRAEIVRDVARRKDLLESILQQIGCEYTRSSANFLMAQRIGGNLHDYLENLEIKTVDLDKTQGIEDQGWCRIAVGSDENLRELGRRVGAWRS
jgi:histidinol-phosphate/aromatic aminotransferase/cobyric acid decarboxylase-like protein